MHKIRYDDQRQALVFIPEGAEKKDYLAGRLNAFVVGRLQDPNKIAKLISRHAPFVVGAVTGYKRIEEKIGGDTVPFMVQASDSYIMTGVLWLDLRAKELQKIESLELKGGYRFPMQVQVQVGEAKIPATTYVKR